MTRTDKVVHMLFIIVATLCFITLIHDSPTLSIQAQENPTNQSMAPPFNTVSSFDDLLKTNPTPSLLKPLYHIRVPGLYPCECALGPADSYLELLPCAWRIAQLELAQQYPQWAEDIYKVTRPRVRITKPWYEVVDRERTLLYGSTEHRKSIPVRIGRTRNMDKDFDSMLHEFKHWIVYKLPLKGLTKWVLNMWVDMVDSDWMKYKIATS